MSKQTQPIGVFDSGVGGISVLKELLKILPGEDFLYFGDSKNAPYGMKAKAEVEKLTIAAAERLLDMGAKGLVVACNTATSAGVKKLRQLYPELPLVGIEPAVKPAVLHKPGGRVLVMATPMTIREEKFNQLMKQYEQEAQIIPLACPGLMDFVERGDLHSQKLESYLEELLFVYKQNPVDAAVLGCTHYPFAKEMIQRVLGANTVIFDGGEGTAREMRRRLAEKDLLNPSSQKGTVTFFNSLEEEEKLRLCEKLLNL